MLKKQVILKIDGFTNWLTPERLEVFVTNLITSVMVLVVTYLLIKFLCFVSSHIFKEKSIAEQTTTTERQAFSKDLLHLARTLANSLIVYGGYFVAAIIILEIFNVKIISPDDLKALGSKLLKIVVILVGARLITGCGQYAIKQIFERKDWPEHVWEKKRTQTLEALLRNILTYVIFFLAGLMILEVFGVNTAAILASAGIIGLAVGFGAQNLVKDIIGGFFILFENQLHVGDFVAIGDVVGTVEEVGLRTCKIRHWTGMLHTIPNGEIKQVTNYNRGQMMAVVTVSIAYEEDVDHATQVLQKEGEIAFREIEDILDTPIVQGITELTEYAVHIRIIAPTTAGKQWPIERELRRRFKYALDRAGIEIPYFKQVFPQPRRENS